MSATADARGKVALSLLNYLQATDSRHIEVCRMYFRARWAERKNMNRKAKGFVCLARLRRRHGLVALFEIFPTRGHISHTNMTRRISKKRTIGEGLLR